MASKKDFDLIIIGGGPAGLTAGIYATRARLKTLLIGKLVPGGQAASTEWVENYPGFPEGIKGPELIEKMKKQADRFGLETLIEEVVSVELQGETKVIKTNNDQLSCKALIIATGTEPKKLNIPGEDKFKGRGVSYCATCDGPFFRDKDVAIIGCGNSGLQEGIFLLKFVKSISFVEFLPRMTAEKILQERIQKEKNTKFFLNHMATSINGENKIESITVKNRETGKEENIPFQGIFIYVGLIPNTKFLEGKLELDKYGFVVTNENTETNIPGVYAAGDVRHKILQQITTATSDGSIAAFMAERYVEKIKEN
ncbi:MAG: thioredoxin reductase [candidate division Zixibacteria bacterium SM23_73_2]|nr:MAG: thioredoxin reductase [candidate division Zixibacteria bacterium SM23_73_2]